MYVIYCVCVVFGMAKSLTLAYAKVVWSNDPILKTYVVCLIIVVPMGICSDNPFESLSSSEAIT